MRRLLSAEFRTADKCPPVRTILLGFGEELGGEGMGGVPRLGRRGREGGRRTGWVWWGCIIFVLFHVAHKEVRKPRISVNCESFCGNEYVSSGAKLPFLL